MITILILALITAVFTSPVNAITIRSGDYISVPKKEIINESLAVASKKIIIDADIKGDLFCAGQDVEINSKLINGDIICAAQNITINSTVKGNLRLAAQTINIQGTVERNITTASQNLSYNATSTGELLSAAENISIDGKVSKNVKLYAQNINLSEKTLISGNLDYISSINANISNSKSVLGKLTHQLPPEVPKEKVKLPKVEISNNLKIFAKIVSIIIHIIVALIFVFFFQKPILKTIGLVKDKSVKVFGWGVFLLTITPIVIILLMITLVGIPFALVLIPLYIIFIMFSRILVSVVLGQLFIKHQSIYLNTAIGVAICYLAFNMPFVGWILSAVAVLYGLGFSFYLVRPKS